ncbi:hypothetical protein DEH84_12615 [Aquabacterium olei]|uniref:Uncharacterized protein n=1 Tax=Aquabacterium olei TaxID=1296669 RepID=A0A2U8FSX7_9BURK|nr:hypothetical protein [Aquabacterium olei]AWI54165.1 hypothetical protein DEH84_12615 [Aquabacterium olei]
MSASHRALLLTTLSALLASTGLVHAQPAAATPADSPAASAPRGAPQAAANPALDLVVFILREAEVLRTVKSLDGSQRLVNPDGLARRGYQYCMVVYAEDYKGLNAAAGDNALQVLGQAQINNVLAGLAGGKVGAARTSDCLQSQGDQVALVSSPEVIAVQRKALALLKSSVPEFARYTPLQEVRYEQLAQAADEAKARRQQAALAARQRFHLFEEKAAADSRDHLASLTLGYPSDDKLRYCTLEYNGDQGAAVIGYAHRGADFLSANMRARIEDRKAKQEGRNGFAKAFASMDVFYQEQQKNPGQCHVFVDFPKNIKVLMGAIERDQGSRKYELNEVVPAQDMREVWARRAGYPDWASSEFADAIKGNAQQVKALGERGITTKAAFDAALAEMKATRYAESNEVREVLAYLDDKKAAGKGRTALMVKQERERAERAATEQRAAEQRRRQAEYAREFPYTATLSCGMGGRHINIAACFTGKYTKTQLEVRNGTTYQMLQAWELGQAGNETGEGLVIPLRPNFSLKAQNTSESLILALTIKDNATGRVIYEKSAAQFGVVNARN